MTTTAVEVLDAALSLGTARPLAGPAALEERYDTIFGRGNPGAMVLPIVYDGAAGARFASPLLNQNAQVVIDETTVAPLDRLWSMITDGLDATTVRPYVQASAAMAWSVSYDGEDRYYTSVSSYRGAAIRLLDAGTLARLLPAGRPDSARYRAYGRRIERSGTKVAPVAASAVDEYMAQQLEDHTDGGISVESWFVVCMNGDSVTSVAGYGKIIGDGPCALSPNPAICDQ